MAKGATHYIQTPRDRRHVTPAAWQLLKDTAGYSLISVEGSEPQQSQQSIKKKEVAGHVEERDDHKVITFDEVETGNYFVNIDPDIDEITSLRDEYESLTGKSPDKRWKEETLKTKIEEAK